MLTRLYVGDVGVFHIYFGQRTGKSVLYFVRLQVILVSHGKVAVPLPSSLQI